MGDELRERQIKGLPLIIAISPGFSQCASVTIEGRTWVVIKTGLLKEKGMVERIDEMQFFDGNAFFGLPMKASLAPVPTAQGFLEEMERAGIGRALVWHIAQHDASPQLGNQLLTEAIQPHARLWGCWTIMPNQAKEFPTPQHFFEEMKAAKIAALRVFPAAHRFLLNALSMGQ
jgi:hypothetical protein